MAHFVISRKNNKTEKSLPGKMKESKEGTDQLAAVCLSWRVSRLERGVYR